MLEPVNWLSRSERKATHAANIAALAKRLRGHEAPLVVAFMKGIAAPVKAAIAASGTSCQFRLCRFRATGDKVSFVQP